MEPKIIVMGFGTFDGIHEGHMDFFKQLRALGDELIIVMGLDFNVEKIKGRPTKRKEAERLSNLKRIEWIDLVIPGNECDFYQCIVDHEPNVIGLGYDQQADVKLLNKRFPHITVVRLKPYLPEKFKSSLL